MKMAFKVVSAFWLLSPVAFLIGRCFGIWNFKFDIFIFLGLMVMSGLSTFLNFNPDE